MAQRQRAGLITLRSLDRNGLPVLLHFTCFTEAGGGLDAPYLLIKEGCGNLGFPAM